VNVKGERLCCHGLWRKEKLSSYLFPCDYDVAATPPEQKEIKPNGASKIYFSKTTGRKGRRKTDEQRKIEIVYNFKEISVA